MKPTNGIAICVTIVITVILTAVVLHSQSSVTISPGSTLSACPAPVASSKALIFCNVAGDSANPDGAYVSANGAAYFRVTTGATAVLPQTIAATSGVCLTGYNATTGEWTTGACLSTITKAQVLATGVAAVTTATTTSSTTSSTTASTTLQ